MAFEIAKTETKEHLKKLLSKYRRSRKGINLKKYVGSVKLNIDGVKYQRKVRDEWR